MHDRHPGGFYRPRYWHGPPMGPAFFHKMKHRWRTFMPYDLEETDSEYIVTMPLPGFDVENVEVSVKANHIYIDAKKPEAELEKKAPHKFPAFGKFLWNRPHIAIKVYIDEEIKPETVKAKLAKGLLTVTVEKIPGKKVNVEA